ncbi:hypothetical protein KO489_01385 [Reinekea forsetii]|nr:hypothetical protein [Reinekea forsetii]
MDYEEHLKSLRESYFRLVPRLRFDIAKKRISNTNAGANEIINKVSALEGVLRSIVIWQLNQNEKPSEDLYNKYRHMSAPKLYEKLCELLGVERIISSETYEVVEYAVKYRNLLAHECTYLGQDTYPGLIKACDELLVELAKLSGAKYP